MDDESAHQVCYVFKPPQVDDDETDQRPKKKRKTSRVVSTIDEGIFPALLGGQESSYARDTRYELYKSEWTRQEQRIDQIINQVSDETFQSIVQFVGKCAKETAPTKLPTGLIVTGASSSLQQKLLNQWREEKSQRSTAQVVSLDSSHLVNITTALKHIIKACITQIDGADAYPAFLAKHKRLVPMNFDLDLLQLLVRDRSVETIVISVLDVETVDIGVLSELVSILASWLDRLPFVLLIGIATTVELLEARLSKSTIRHLHPQIFDLSPHSTSLHDICHPLEGEAHADTRLWLGPVALNILAEMANEQETTSEAIKQALKYAYMSHFFANPLSFMPPGPWELDTQTVPGLGEAIRNTESFKVYVEEKMTEGRLEYADQLLNDNERLFVEVAREINTGLSAMSMHQEALHLLLNLTTFLAAEGESDGAQFELEFQTFSPDTFLTSDRFADIKESIELLPSDQFADLLGILTKRKMYMSTGTDQPISSIRERHLQLIAKSKSGLIRSARDLSPPSSTTHLSGTHPVQRVGTAPKLSALEKSYTELLEDFVQMLTTYLEESLVDPKSLFMNEAFVYDLKVPLSGVFAPRPRFAVERALERPGDYLGCDCCTMHDTRNGADQHTRRNGSTAPPTCILWQRWCEAGSTVNVRDLWEAFRTTLAPRSTADEDEADGAEAMEADPGSETGTTDRRALALFYRSLAELRMLGFVKASSRKAGVECLAKTTWRGL